MGTLGRRSGTIYGWHVCDVDRRLGYEDGRAIEFDEWLAAPPVSDRVRARYTAMTSTDWPLTSRVKLCVHGMHASHLILDALAYRRFGYLCRVRLRGQTEGYIAGAHHDTSLDDWGAFWTNRLVHHQDSKFCAEARQVLWAVPVLQLLSQEELRILTSVDTTLDAGISGLEQHFKRFLNTPRQAEAMLLRRVRRLRAKQTWKQTWDRQEGGLES